jgi:hypothetical protein
VQVANREFGAQQALRAKAGLKAAIVETRAIKGSPQLASLMNLRDKHLAHSLSETRREKRGPVAPAKYGYERDLLMRSIPVVENLYTWANGTSFAFADSQNYNQENAEALWKGCKFDVLN